MGQLAERVYTDPERIRQLEALIAKLPGNADVTLSLDDGSTCRAIVSVRPSIEVFRDGNGNEGSNALMRLERPEQPQWSKILWLDRITDVQHNDSTLGSAT